MELVSPERRTFRAERTTDQWTFLFMIANVSLGPHRDHSNNYLRLSSSVGQCTILLISNVLLHENNLQDLTCVVFVRLYCEAFLSPRVNGIGCNHAAVFVTSYKLSLSWIHDWKGP